MIKSSKGAKWEYNREPDIKSFQLLKAKHDQLSIFVDFLIFLKYDFYKYMNSFYPRKKTTTNKSDNFSIRHCGHYEKKDPRVIFKWAFPLVYNIIIMLFGCKNQWQLRDCTVFPIWICPSRVHFRGKKNEKCVSPSIRQQF